MSQLSQFIMNHWPLAIALLVVIALILINELHARKHQATKISPSRLVQMMNHDNISIYDLRPIEAFREGHILNSTRAHKEEFDKAPLQKLKEKPFVLVCDTGINSATTANHLKQNGFEQAMVLEGGVRAWQAADLPLSKGK